MVYNLSNVAEAKLKRVVREVLHEQRIGAQRRPNPPFNQGPPTRVGKVYNGPYSAATATEPKEIEVIFDRIKTNGDTLAYVDPETSQPTRVVNLGGELNTGDRVICWLDYTGKYSPTAGNSVCDPVWITGKEASSGKQGFGILRGQGDFTGTITDGFYVENFSAELVNSDDLDPTITAGVSTIGPPVKYNRLIAEESGNYQLGFHAGIYIDSPAEPGGVYSYEHMIGTVTDGLTQNLCSHILRKLSRFVLYKNIANFSTTPTGADTLATGDVWAEYKCNGRIWGDYDYVIPIELNAGDHISVWFDDAFGAGSPAAQWVVRTWLHYLGPEVELS